MSQPILSVILPMYNESAVVERALRVIGETMTRVGMAYELVCVDDGSRDDTLRLLERARESDDRVVVVELSRNFGKEAAMAAGLDQARGDAVLLLDSDLQHPPELIPEMVRAWCKGNDVVNGVKASRGEESFAYKSFARVFYFLMGSAAGRSFAGASDFKLLDRQVVEALRQCPERHRFFRGLVAWVGFRACDVPFAVQERAAGETKWSYSGLLRYSLKNLLAFSAAPLRMIALLGAGTLLLAGLLGAWTLFRWARGDSLAGFPTVILLQLIFGGLMLTCLGVISLYLAEMYDEMKRRPVYLCRVAGGNARPRPSFPE